MRGKRIVLGVTGSIAAYKAVSLLRALVQEGAEVSVVMTPSATRFVTPLTFEVLSGRPVVTDLFEAHAVMPHLSLSEEADLLVIAPATANTIAKCALGLADDVLSTMVITARCPLLLAPAMDGGMWEHPTVVTHTRALRERGVMVLDTEEGALASGQIGRGRLPSEVSILSAIRTMLASRCDCRGQRFLVSAGPTREPFDAIRFLSNPSTGKMGYAVAQAAVDRGAEVVLVSGPTSLSPPAGVEIIPVMTADDMYQALAEKFSWSTVLIMAAAVGDFRPKNPGFHKMKKQQWDGSPWEMEKTKDILAALSSVRQGQLLVGFAAETQNLVEQAQRKRAEKNLDLLVANRIGGAQSAFGADENEVTMINRHGAIQPLPRMPKRIVADRIIDEVLALLSQQGAMSDDERKVG